MEGIGFKALSNGKSLPESLPGQTPSTVDPDAKLLNVQPPSDWSNFTKIQGTPRVMQIGLRFSF